VAPINACINGELLVYAFTDNPLISAGMVTAAGRDCLKKSLRFIVIDLTV
jgi:hypothetical protein